MNKITVSEIILGILILVSVIMIVSGLLVSRDARKRGMNPVSWGLIAAFGPVLIGVIVYLVSRRPIVEYSCSNCGESAYKGMKVCPNCGRAFVEECENCGYDLNPSWKICPSCGKAIREDGAKLIKEYQKSKSSLGIFILIGAIAIILVLVAVVLPINVFRDAHYYSYLSTSITGNIGMGNITKDELSVNESIGEWIEKCDNSDGDVYVLISKAQGIGIIYLKDLENLCDLSGDLVYTVDDEFNMYLTAVDSGVNNKYGFDFYVFEADMDYDINIEANIPGNTFADVEITYTDADISKKTWNK